jgi:glycosyltransferase involved in cell wall biosynthesis
MAPAVSVIVPAYRTADYIAAALESVLAQSFRDFEIVVVNDGCPESDRLERALEPYRSRIRYIRKENGGPGSARNAGILAAEAPLVAMLDSDDIWDPEYLSVHTEMFRQDPSIDAVYPNAVFFGDTSEAGRTFMEMYPSTGAVTFLSLIARRTMVSAFVTARRETLIRAGLYDTQFSVGEDLALWLRIAKMGGRIVYHTRPLVRYRRRAGSLTVDNLKSLEQVGLVLEKIGATLELNAEERRALDRELESIRAGAALERGRIALRARDWTTARRNLEEANRHFRAPKTALLIVALRFAPWLVGPAVRRRYGRTP